MRCQNKIQHVQYEVALHELDYNIKNLVPVGLQSSSLLGVNVYVL